MCCALQVQVLNRWLLFSITTISHCFSSLSYSVKLKEINKKVINGFMEKITLVGVLVRILIFYLNNGNCWKYVWHIDIICLTTLIVRSLLWSFLSEFRLQQKTKPFSKRQNTAVAVTSPLHCWCSLSLQSEIKIPHSFCEQSSLNHSTVYSNLLFYLLFI